MARQVFRDWYHEILNHNLLKKEEITIEGAINYTGAWITIAIVAVAFLFFLTEWIPLMATAIAVPAQSH